MRVGDTIKEMEPHFKKQKQKQKKPTSLSNKLLATLKHQEQVGGITEMGCKVGMIIRMV